MSNPPRWLMAYRQTGRTTRALAKAFRAAFNGEHVAFVVGHPGDFRYCRPILYDMGAERFSESLRRVTVQDGSITFKMWNAEDVDRYTFNVQGWRGPVIWDHDAVRMAYNHVLERYHEHD